MTTVTQTCVQNIMFVTLMKRGDKGRHHRPENSNRLFLHILSPMFQFSICDNALTM